MFGGKGQKKGTKLLKTTRTQCYEGEVLTRVKS